LSRVPQAMSRLGRCRTGCQRCREGPRLGPLQETRPEVTPDTRTHPAPAHRTQPYVRRAFIHASVRGQHGPGACGGHWRRLACLQLPAWARQEGVQRSCVVPASSVVSAGWAPAARRRRRNPYEKSSKVLGESEPECGSTGLCSTHVHDSPVL
jgi:hypothetical protein